VTRTLSAAAPMFILNLQMHMVRLEAALPERPIIKESPQAFVDFEHPMTVGSIERVDEDPQEGTCDRTSFALSD